MLSTLEQLEQDIEQFRKNVSDIGRMGGMLTELTEAIREQGELFRESTDEVDKSFRDATAAIATNKQALDAAYERFLTDLSNTDFQRIAVLCEETRDTLNRKMLHLHIAMGVTVITMIVSLFLR